ncbi:MAG: glycosyltransferase [Bacteroidetes bacterium]|nr:glycosyltransferase [Bacteroidota bacterium]
MASDFSFIVPVYNRPEEIRELLESFCTLEVPKTFEVVIVEDGSTLDARLITEHFSDQLNISYYFKDNTGPGHSRNYGMERAKGNYFIILDSDCILPKQYLTEVISFLNTTYVDCFGGPDAAQDNFTELQKAINFSMTSMLTTGGIRGGSKEIEGYEPRSFNMGLSKEAFCASGGFGAIHPGEDPDLSIRLKAMGYRICLIPEAFVYHKRRVSLERFFVQVYKFGQVRPILNKWHPHSKKWTYWFPTFFMLGFFISLLLLFFDVFWAVYLYGAYFLLAVILAFQTTLDVVAALLSIPAILIQFSGYGWGFLKAKTKLIFSRKTALSPLNVLFFKIS